MPLFSVRKEFFLCTFNSLAFPKNNPENSLKSVFIFRFVSFLVFMGDTVTYCMSRGTCSFAVYVRLEYSRQLLAQCHKCIYFNELYHSILKYSKCRTPDYPRCVITSHLICLQLLLLLLLKKMTSHGISVSWNANKVHIRQDFNPSYLVLFPTIEIQ